MVPLTTVPLMLQRKAEHDEEVALVSQRFIRNAAKMMPNNIIARAMPMAEAARVANEEERAANIFLKLENEATLPENIRRELTLSTLQMINAAKELGDAIKNEGLNKTSRMSLPTMFSSDAQERLKEHRVSKAIVDTIEIIDRFSGVLNFIPIDNDYIHVITGVLKTISEATLNHRKIGEGFHNAVQQIGEEMKYCGSTLAQAQHSSQQGQQKVKIHIANFFNKVFAFLIPYTKWCKSRFTRFQSSLNKNFYQESVEGPLNNILRETRRLEREGNLQVQEGVFQVVRGQDIMERKVDQLASQLEKLQMRLEDNSTKRCERKADAEKHAQEQNRNRLILNVGKLGTGFVEVMTDAELKRHLLEKETRERLQDAHRTQQLSNPWTTLLRPENISKLAAIAAKDKTVQFVEVELASRHLEVATYNGYPINLIAAPEDMPMASAIFKRVQEWISTEDSQRLWIHGPAYVDGQNTVSLAAASIVLMSEQNKMSLIAYRIHVGDLESLEMADQTLEASTVVNSNSSVEMERLIMMVYSLIRQMVWLLPDNIDTESDLSFERFYQLDGTIQSLPEAFNFFEELLDLMPSHLFVIIDGIQLVDGDRYDLEGLGSSGCFDSFLELLWNGQKKSVLKVLLTSDGLCSTLVCEHNIRFDEVMEVLETDMQRQGEVPEFWEVLESN